MELTKRALYLGLMVSVIAGMSALLSIKQETDMAIVSYALAGILVIFLGRALTGNYSNFTMVFLTFSALYSLSGSIDAHFSGSLPDIYPTPYRVDEFLLHYSLAVIGIASGLMFVAGLKCPRINATKPPNWNSEILLKLAYTFAAIASISEIVNFLRVGGFATLYAGKVVYVSAVSQLTGTLPSTVIILLSSALLGLSLSASDLSRKISTQRVVMWLVYSLPLILSAVIIGERRTLLSILIVLIIGILYFNPIKKIEFKLFAYVFIIYLTMAFLYGIRSIIGPVLTTHDLSILMIRIYNPTFWLTILNPASVEFSCAFGNFNTYILSGASDLRLGGTYLQGLIEPIPRLIWPDKPHLIAVEFRNTFFPELVLKGAHAGTAYSSILEAYVNFGTIGVPIIYLFIGLALGCMERIRMQTRSLFFAIFYLTMLPEAIIFHRGSMGNPIFWPLFLAFVGSLAYISINSIYRQIILNKGDG